MLRRKAKRYRVSRSGDGYEVQDADAAGVPVPLSESRKPAGKVSRQLNNTQRSHDKISNWGESSPGGGG